MNVATRRKFLGHFGALIAGGLLPAAIARAVYVNNDGVCTRPTRIDSLGGPGGYTDDTSAPLVVAALDDARASGLCAVNVTVSGVGSYARNYDETIKNIAYWNAQIAAHPDRLMQARAIADLDMARCTDKLALIYGFQDATPLGEDLDRVDTFRDLGVRIFQLTYNRRNLIGDGCLESGNAGLSEFGRKLVAKLNERKLLVDLSHAGERTTLEAIAVSKSPIAISHTGCAALAPLPRNKTDNELKQLADKGGYAGIYLMPFLRSKGQPMAADLIAHLEHAINVCGEDHVGIGSDGVISPIEVTPEFKKKFADEINERRKRGISAPGEDPNVYTFIPDLNRADRFVRIGELLAARGHSAARIDKVLGGNFARLLKEVWES
jgi:membrane dipeptidase